MYNKTSFGGSGGTGRRKFGGVVGVGYISIMLIFTVICLTIFAVLSFQAAYSNNRLSVRSGEFTQQYYTADAAAKKTLSQLDLLAAQAADSFSFEESFIEGAEDLSGVNLTRVPEGIQADYSLEINDRQSLSVSVLFYRTVTDNRYKIISWQSTSEEISGDNHQSVWDGGELVL